MKTKIIFFGTPLFVVPVLEYLDKNFQVVGVVTTPDERIGRKQTLTPTPIAQYATGHNIPVFKPVKLSDENFKFKISNFKFDLAVVAAYGKIIPQNILELPKFGSINIHPSLLPKYRGPSPIQAAILNEDTVTGVSIIQMDAQMDHGPVITAKEIVLSSQDTFQTLSNKIFADSIDLLTTSITQLVEEKAYLQPQDDTKATYCHIIKKEDGYFDINNPPSPEILDRIIRAYYPWPGVWTIWEGKNQKSKVKKIVKFYPKNLVQMEGKKPVSIKDFLNGYSSFPLKVLITI